MDRRTLLRTSTGTVVASLLVPGQAVAGTRFPDVPGMLGDRRANEFWYQFDEQSFFNPSDQLIAAYTAMQTHLGEPDFTIALRDKWLEFVAAPGYPWTFADYMAPLRDHFQVLSDFQLGLFDSFYRPGSHEFAEAFAYFGQGVLFDPRRAAVEAEVHTMNRTPPVAYHSWYVIQRAMMLLGVESSRWEKIGPVTGYAWALQSLAQPSLRTPNPGLPETTVRRLAWDWLPKSIRRLDQDFRSFPFPSGMR